MQRPGNSRPLRLLTWQAAAITSPPFKSMVMSETFIIIRVNIQQLNKPAHQRLGTAIGRLSMMKIMHSSNVGMKLVEPF